MSENKSAGEWDTLPAATFLGPAEGSGLNSLMSTLGQPVLTVRPGIVGTTESKSEPASYGTDTTKTASQATISEGKISEAKSGHERSLTRSLRAHNL
jgi:hypothetical protein